MWVVGSASNWTVVVNLAVIRLTLRLTWHRLSRLRRPLPAVLGALGPRAIAVFLCFLFFCFLCLQRRWQLRAASGKVLCQLKGGESCMIASNLFRALGGE